MAAVGAELVEPDPAAGVELLMHRFRPAAGTIVMLTAAACTGPNSSEASVDPTPLPAASATASAAASADAVELETSASSLPPGRYTRSGFAPPITLTLDEGWRAVQLYDGFFDVQQDVGSPRVIAVQFATPLGVYGADGADAIDDPSAAVAALRANPGLTVIESSESRIGGLTGEQVTVENAGSEHATVLDVPPGPLGIDPGRRLWIAFFDTDDGLLAIMVGGSVERWDEALLTAEPVLESVEVGP
jgi:hypothetical protein